MANTPFIEAYFERLKSTIDGLDRAAIANMIDVIRAGWQDGFGTRPP